MPTASDSVPVSHSLVLFAHGARDPAWAAPFQRLQTMTQAAMPQVRVELAFLELMQPDLPILAAQLAAEGIERITIVPVFLGQGGHVRRDLPRLVDALRVTYPAMAINAVDAAGEDAAVLQAIASYCVRAAGA